MMKRTPEEWGEEEHSMDLLITFGNKIEAKSYKYFTDEEKFVDSLNAMTKELADATKPTLELYRKVEADKRVEMMLHSLNDCSTFDEQCSLFLNWADSPEAELENEWIVAVAEKLMNSGNTILVLTISGLSGDACINIAMEVYPVIPPYPTASTTICARNAI